MNIVLTMLLKLFSSPLNEGYAPLIIQVAQLFTFFNLKLWEVELSPTNKFRIQTKSISMPPTLKLLLCLSISYMQSEILLFFFVRGTHIPCFMEIMFYNK